MYKTKGYTMTTYEDTLNALHTIYDHQLDCEVMDINKAGEEYDVGKLDFQITMQSTISKMIDRMQIVEKMVNSTERRITYFKDQKGTSSALTSLSVSIQTQEIDQRQLGQLEKQLKARQFQFDILFNRLKAHLNYYEEKMGEAWEPYQAKNVVRKDTMSVERKKELNQKEIDKVKAFYNENYGKIEKPLDNEDGTISSELIPAYA